mgnify:FL=1
MILGKITPILVSVKRFYEVLRQEPFELLHIPNFIERLLKDCSLCLAVPVSESRLAHVLQHKVGEQDEQSHEEELAAMRSFTFFPSERAFRRLFGKSTLLLHKFLFIQAANASVILQESVLHSHLIYEFIFLLVSVIR